MGDTSLVFNLVARDRASEELERLRERFAGVGNTVAKISGIGLAIPGLAAVVAGAAGLASGAVAAGLAVKAFQAAAVPQLESVTGAWELYSQAQDAAAKGGEDAAQAQEAYAQALAGMTPATRDTAEAFVGLKSDFGEWSDSLSGTTMPVFTKGIETLRDLLPTMTPFVEAASGALGGFVDEIAAGTRSAGFKQWAEDMANAAGPALSDFLTVIKNLGIGFGGLLQAFLPVSSGMTGGLADMSAAFADWGANLQHTEGFAQFLDTASTGGETLGLLAGAAVNVFTAVAPLLGTTAMLANGFARIVNATPTPVLTAVAGALVTVRVGMMAYSAVTAAVAARNAIMAASQTPVILGWIRMNAVGLAAYARIAAGAVASAVTTAAAWTGSALVSIGTWALAVIRAGVTAAVQFALMAARAIAWAAVMAAQWLIAMGPIGWIILAVAGLVALIVLYWDQIKQWTLMAWDWIVGKLIWAKDMMIQAFMNFTLIGLILSHWTSIKNTAVSWWNSIVGWVKGVPGRLYNLWLNWSLPGLIVKHWSSIKTGTVNKATEMVNWVRGIPGRITSALGNLGHLLYNSGASLINGFINGIKAQIGRVRDAASSVVSAARDFFPFSPAKEGPFAGHGYTSYSGEALVQGFQQGITSQIPALQSLLNSLPGVAPQAVQATPLTAGMAPSLGTAAGSGTVTRVVIDVRGADEDLKKLFRKLVRVDGRGSVQTAFGH